jgi:hypothetical protein
VFISPQKDELVADVHPLVEDVGIEPFVEPHLVRTDRRIVFFEQLLVVGEPADHQLAQVVSNSSCSHAWIGEEVHEELLVDQGLVLSRRQNEKAETLFRDGKADRGGDGS